MIPSKFSKLTPKTSIVPLNTLENIPIVSDSFPNAPPSVSKISLNMPDNSNPIDPRLPNVSLTIINPVSSIALKSVNSCRIEPIVDFIENYYRFKIKH